MAKLSNRTFGVEFELLFKDLENFLLQNAKFLDEQERKTLHYDYVLRELDNVPTDEIYPIIEAILNNAGFTDFGVKADGSIKGFGFPAEVITPILQGPSGLKQVIRFCNFIAPHAFVNDTTGLHVHVGAKDFISDKGQAAEKLLATMLQYKNVEHIFDSLVAQSRQNNRFAESNPEKEKIIHAYKKIIEDEVQHIDDIVELLDQERYRKLNITSLLEHGTIEFRQMHGTFNAELVKNWIILCMTFLDEVKKTENIILKMLNEFKNDVSAKKDEARPERVADYFYSTFANFIKMQISRIEDNFNADKHLETLLDQYPDVGQMRRTQFNYSQLPNQFIGNKEYYVFSLPVTTFEIFKPGKELEGMKYLDEKFKEAPIYMKHLQSDGILNQVTGNSYNVFVPKDNLQRMVGTTPELRTLPATADQVSKIDSTMKQGVTQYRLPQRNVSKAFQQNVTSPLQEEIAALLKLIG